ncbi:RHS repeat-associated core domain-containing protein, partial [Klebsiella aerogenes]
GSSLPSATVPLPTDSSAFTNYTRTYSYDSAGNLTQIRHSAPATNNSYTTNITVSDKSNRGMLSTQTENPSDVDALFTAGGQQKQLQPGQSLVWTVRNELLKVTPVVREGDAADYEGYRYDAGSQRLLKVSVQKTGNNTQTQRALYLTGLELRTMVSGNTKTESLQVITTGEAGRAQVRVLRWTCGKPDAISNDQVRYSYDNLTGSSSLELDGEGNVISMEEFYPYGGTAVWTARSQMEADYKTVRYSGQERDATGLYYYGYRYYQPWAGRWLSSDPAGTVDGMNLFRMVRNNPATLLDSDGRLPSSLEQNEIDAHARRAGLQPSIQNYQQALHGVFHAHGKDAYNELWISLNQKIPLNSTDNITHKHMASIADFVEKRKIISGMIYSSTTPANMDIDITQVRFHLQKIPLNVLKKANDLGQFITVTNDNITNHPTRNNLKGVTPRGWNNGLTWESVPGVGAMGKGTGNNLHPDETVIALRKNAAQEWQIATGHGSTSLVLHEYAHAIDRSFGEKANMGDTGSGEQGDFLSRRRSFRVAWEADLNGTPNTASDYYYWQGGNDGGAEEAFAEGFSDIYAETGRYNWINIKAYIYKKMKSIGTYQSG